MPTDKDRVSITWPPELYDLIIKDMEAQERSFSWIVVHAMKEHYALRRDEARVFTPTELNEAVRRRAPVFETKHPPEIVPLSGNREPLNREKS